MENFDSIPSPTLKMGIKLLIDTLNSNAGLYDSDEVLGTLYTLRKEIRKSSQKELHQTYDGHINNAGS
jgi:hypothetical protein